MHFKWPPGVTERELGLFDSFLSSHLTGQQLSLVVGKKPLFFLGFFAVFKLRVSLLLNGLTEGNVPIYSD